MDNKWAEDTFKSFEQEHGEAPSETFTQMLLRLEYWCDTKGLKFSEAHRRAKAYKQMFDAADYLVKEGFTRVRSPKSSTIA